MLHNGQLKILLDLYLRFRNKKGTWAYISEYLDSPNGHTRHFLKKLTEIGVLIHNEYIHINGKNYEVYSVNEEKLIEVLKEDETFKMITTILYDNYDKVFGHFSDIYTKEELKQLVTEMIR